MDQEIINGNRKARGQIKLGGEGLFLRGAVGGKFRSEKIKAALAYRRDSFFLQ